MKRVFFIILCCFISVFAMVSLFGNTNKNIDFAKAEEVEEIEEIKTGTVVISNTEYGDVLSDVQSGNVGDIVTLTIKTYMFTSLESINVNGKILTADSNGVYKFALIEGENIVTAKFIVNQEQVAFIAQMVEDAKNGDWGKIFSMSNLSQILNWTITIVMGIGYFFTLIKSKKIKAETTENITKTYTALTTAEYGKSITAFLEKTIKPITNEINAKIGVVEDTCKVLARCMILEQENTPEARLAIIKELTNLKVENNNLAAQVQSIINAEIEKAKIEEKNKLQAIEDIEKANDSIETIEIKKENENYGQL